MGAQGFGRRAALAGLAGAAAPGVARAAAAASDQGQWLQWQARYLAAEGRVVDTGNGGVSHSEGQGYGLLLAEAFADRPSFTRILGWTRARLLRPDGLHAWRWRPEDGVADRNNASDGDLYIAWALLRAAERWAAPEYAGMAVTIGQAMADQLLPELRGRVVLLPGGTGFAGPQRVMLNPSYYAFPAMAALAAATGDARWWRAMADGVTLLRQARFGRWGLPADWVELAHAGTPLPSPARGRPARFSYDAVRVPLHLAWAGLTEEPALEAAVRFWRGNPVPPAWADLASGQSGAEPASTGVVAIARLAHGSRHGRVALPALPQLAPGMDYYSASLTLLARLAALEAPPPGLGLALTTQAAPKVALPPAKS